MAGPTRYRTFIGAHPKLGVALVVIAMITALLFGPTRIEFWVALVLLVTVGFSGGLRN